MKYILYFALTLLHIQLFAQSSIVIRGSVKDSQTKESLPLTNIDLKGTDLGVSADVDGAYRLEIPLELLPGELVFSFVGYGKETIKITNESNQKLDIFLKEEQFNLNEITIKYNNSIVFGNQDYLVLDYTLLEDYIILVVSQNKISRPFLILANMEGETLNISSIPRRHPIMLYLDCLNELYLVCKNYPIKISTKNDSLKISTVPLNEYNRLMKPCVASYKADIFYQKYGDEMKSSLKYYIQDAYTDTSILFAEINDTNKVHENLSQLDSSYVKLLLKERKLNNTSIIENNSSLNHNSLLTEVYAPLFVKSDTIIIFDHINNQISFLDSSANITKRIPISYTNLEGWKPLVLKDSETESFYTITLNKGKTSVYKICTLTGLTELISIINFNWIEKIRIYNNTAYFLYQNDESNYEKKLYWKNFQKN